MAALKAAIDVLKEPVEAFTKRRPKVESHFPTFGEKLLYSKDDEADRRKKHVASTYTFNFFIGLNVILASLILGIELDQNLGANIEDRLIFFLADFYFLVLFFVELLVKVHKLHWDYFSNSWDIFDYALVVVHFADFASSVQPDRAGGTKVASTFRMLRLLRITGYIEGIKMFRGMWMVLKGMIESIRSIFWTGIFVCVVIYGFGVILSTSVAEEAVVFEKWEHADLYVGSVPRCIFTTLQVFTFDAWASVIARPLFELGYTQTVMFFICTIIICNFGILNMIIALMVEKFVSLRKVGKSLKKVDEELLAALAMHFVSTDMDSNGALDRQEFARLLKSDEVIYKLRLLGLYVEEASGLFDLLDVDKNGEIEPDEFFKGLSKLRGEARSVDLMHLVASALRFKKRSADNVRRVQEVGRQVDEMQRRLNMVGMSLTGEMNHRLYTEQRNQDVREAAEVRQNVIDKMHTDHRTFFASLAENEGSEYPTEDDDDASQAYSFSTAAPSLSPTGGPRPG